MCNCLDTSPCSKCQNGQPCNCPADYSVMPQPSNCKCCPQGYSYVGITPNYPNGFCCPTGHVYDSSSGSCIPTVIVPDSPPVLITPVSTIPCTECVDSVTTDCVFYDGTIPIACGTGVNNVYGINPGDSLTTIINKMCIVNKNVLEAMISAIGLDTDLLSAFCQLTGACLPSGTTVPVIGPVVVTFP